MFHVDEELLACRPSFSRAYDQKMDLPGPVIDYEIRLQMRIQRRKAHAVLRTI
jgi:hypothetical protein